MKITKQWITETFNQFNKDYFNNELPLPSFTITDTRKMLGQCGAKNWRAEHPNFNIKISNFYDRTEHEYKNTLLHEMIHLYFQSHKEWTVGHGRKFQLMARSFDKHGFNIHTTEQGFHGKTSNGKIPLRMIMTFKDMDKKIWLCCISQDMGKVQNFEDQINRSQNYKEPEFYVTDSDKFSSMKICQSRLGGKRMTENHFTTEYLPLLTKI